MPVERKYERDIDILLAEEFAVSPAFAAWFLAQTKFAGRTGNVASVHVSKADNLGESDLVVTYALDDGDRIALLIEDKIDAPLQPKQAERYRLRADREKESGAFESYEVILCAPASYPVPSAHQQFDRIITYESIGAAFASTDNSERGSYRADFVVTAASRRSNGWVREQDDATDRFWDAIYNLAAKEFSILERKPIFVTKNTAWINFRPSDLPTAPKPVYVAMKANMGFMDLTFGKTDAGGFRDQIGELLADDMTIHQTGESSSIRIVIPSFVVADGIEMALPKARIALASASKLIEFYRNHRSELNAASINAERCGNNSESNTK